MRQIIPPPSSRPEPICRQVERHLRTRIMEGALVAGQKLPTNHALAEQIGTSVFTIQTALGRLCREGLLVRKTGVGTFVAGTSDRLACVGIFLNNPLDMPEMGFYQALCRRIKERLSARGIQVRYLNEERPEEARTSPPAFLREAIERREIQGLIVPASSYLELAWMQKLPIPVAHCTSNESAANRVLHDTPRMLRLALEALREQGCRTMGLVSSCTSNRVDFYEAFLELVETLGLETRNDWIASISHDEIMPSRRDFGYQATRRILQQADRPDGLLVWPDEVACGAVMALLECRIDIPGKLKVALHVNDALAYPCPFPATLMVTRVGVWADKLIEMLECQLQGEEVRPIILPPLLRQSPLAPGYLD